MTDIKAEILKLKKMNFNNVAIFSPKKKKGKKVDCYDFPGKNAVKLF